MTRKNLHQIDPITINSIKNCSNIMNLVLGDQKNLVSKLNGFYFVNDYISKREKNKPQNMGDKVNLMTPISMFSKKNGS